VISSRASCPVPAISIRQPSRSSSRSHYQLVGPIILNEQNTPTHMESGSRRFGNRLPGAVFGRVSQITYTLV
jgi:hypothetical protein